MIICGVKLTHDGGLAVLETSGSEARLLVQVDMEKVDNNERYSPVPSSEVLSRLFELSGLTADDVSILSIDGWFNGEAWLSPLIIPTPDTHRLKVAPYEESAGRDDIHEAITGSLPVGGGDWPYVSYRHVTDHIATTRFTSPMGRDDEHSLVLVWDGGVVPRLYEWDRGARRARFLTILFPVLGNTYGFFGAALTKFRFPRPDMTPEEARLPFPEQMIRHNLSTPGKMMAYAGLGTGHDDYVASIERIYGELDWTAPKDTLTFAQKAAIAGGEMGLSDADMIASFQVFVGRLLVTALKDAVSQLPAPPRSIALAGGCALNIKWNSMIRDAGIFEQVWVPPFPNDSGVALGAALAAAMASSDVRSLEWSVYSGLPVPEAPRRSWWRPEACSPRELGRRIHEWQEPVVVLSGRAELGPRALGHRSIFAPAVTAGMKDVLNDVKRREHYRPVAPICLERLASQIFEPGGRDPFMLFDHRVRPSWKDRIPAIVHVDGTARLQTINEHDDPVTAAILEGYREASDIPVLCNTSANLPGRGFFPDVDSALEWGKVPRVWSDGVLRTRTPA